LRCKFFSLACVSESVLDSRLFGSTRLGSSETMLMCVQEEETIQHIMVSCVFSREIWYQVLSLVGLQQCLPRPSDTVFQEWWQASELRCPNNIVRVSIHWWPSWFGGCGSIVMHVSLRPPTMLKRSSNTSRMMPGYGAWLVQKG
jgi:hypothetical protein